MGNSVGFSAENFMTGNTILICPICNAQSTGYNRCPLCGFIFDSMPQDGAAATKTTTPQYATSVTDTIPIDNIPYNMASVHSNPDVDIKDNKTDNQKYKAIVEDNMNSYEEEIKYHNSDKSSVQTYNESYEELDTHMINKPHTKKSNNKESSPIEYNMQAMTNINHRTAIAPNGYDCNSDGFYDPVIPQQEDSISSIMNKVKLLKCLLAILCLIIIVVISLSML